MPTLLGFLLAALGRGPVPLPVALVIAAIGLLAAIFACATIMRRSAA